MTEQDRFDWSVSIILAAMSALFSMVFMVITICIDVRAMSMMKEVEAHVEEVQTQCEELAHKMSVQQDVFASVVKGIQGEW